MAFYSACHIRLIQRIRMGSLSCYTEDSCSDDIVMLKRLTFSYSIAIILYHVKLHGYGLNLFILYRACSKRPRRLLYTRKLLIAVVVAKSAELFLSIMIKKFHCLTTMFDWKNTRIRCWTCISEFHYLDMILGQAS